MFYAKIMDVNGYVLADLGSRHDLYEAIDDLEVAAKDEPNAMILEVTREKAGNMETVYFATWNEEEKDFTEIV